MKRAVFAALLLALFSAGSVFAAHPLVTDDTCTHGSGNYQLEVNGEAGFDRRTQDGVATKTSSQQIATILSAGFGERVDLVLGLPWQRTRQKVNGAVTMDSNGAGDFSVELKWRFFERDGFSLAVKPGVTLPTGDEGRGLGNGRLSGGVIFIASKEMAPLTMLLNAGYSRNEYSLESDRQANRNDHVQGSLAMLVAIVKTLQVVGEVGLDNNNDRTSRAWPAFVTGGLIYSVRDNMDLDLGLKCGLNDPATDLALLAGFSMHF